jgi:simple sugar transport system ATP-binding protein
LLPPKLSLLLLENPTRGLDVESARRIWSLLLERRDDQTAIIFSSPDLDEILDYSDRVLVFSSGRVTLVEDPSQLTTARLGELIGGKA